MRENVYCAVPLSVTAPKLHIRPDGLRQGFSFAQKGEGYEKQKGTNDYRNSHVDGSSSCIAVYRDFNPDNAELY